MLKQVLSGIILLMLILPGCGKKNKEKSELGKVFRYNQAEGLSSLDPAFARNQANIWATTQIYNGLFELENDLTSPCIAETWNISEDGLTYTFNLKKGVYFHDSEVFPNGKGREVKAADFVYSFKRIMDPATASTGAWVFNNKVVRNKKGEIVDTCITSVGDYTLRIHLQKPFPAFLQILAMPYTFVVPKEAVEKYGKDFRVHPVGTGAFMFKSWEEGNSLILLKNVNYWKKDESGTKLPYLDAVQVSFIPDKNQEFLTFQQGKLDFISGLEENSKDKILNKNGSINDEFKSKYDVQKVPYVNTEYIGFQLDPSKYQDKKHPFLNKKFRQALSWAINREELVSFILNNLGTPATSGFVPAALPSFDKEKVIGYSYNVEKALALLKEAGYPEGKGLPELKLNTTNQSKPIVEYLQKQWKAIGVSIKIEINQVPTHQEMVDNGKVTFFRGSWLADYPDAENYLGCFYSKNFAPSGPNKTHFSNPEFDKLYEKALIENDGWKRFEIYQQMDQILMSDAAVIVLFYDEVLRLTQKYVKGLETDGMNVLKLEKADIINETE